MCTNCNIETSNDYGSNFYMGHHFDFFTHGYQENCGYFKIYYCPHTDQEDTYSYSAQFTNHLRIDPDCVHTCFECLDKYFHWINREVVNNNTSDRLAFSNIINLEDINYMVDIAGYYNCMKCDTIDDYFEVLYRKAIWSEPLFFKNAIKNRNVIRILNKKIKMIKAI